MPDRRPILRKARSVAADGLRLFASVLPAQDLAPVRFTIWSWNKVADWLEPAPLRAPRVATAPATPPVADEPSPPSAPETPLEIDTRELTRMLSQTRAPVLLDVREPIETASGIIPAAQLIPMRSVLEHVGELRKVNGPIVVYCAHGVRSANVALHLRDRGIQAVSLEGGIAAWRAAQGQIEAPPSL